MGMLTGEQRIKTKLAHGKNFDAVCDEPDCGRLIAVGELCIVTKWRKREKTQTQFLGPIAEKVRCMVCENHANGSEDKKEKGKKVKERLSKSATSGDKYPIIPEVRKAVLRILRSDEEVVGLSDNDLVLRLRRKVKLREFTKSQMKRTFRGMKVKKELKRSKKLWMVAPTK